VFSRSSSLSIPLLSPSLFFFWLLHLWVVFSLRVVLRVGVPVCVSGSLVNQQRVCRCFFFFFFGGSVMCVHTKVILRHIPTFVNMLCMCIYKGLRHQQVHTITLLVTLPFTSLVLLCLSIGSRCPRESASAVWCKYVDHSAVNFLSFVYLTRSCQDLKTCLRRSHDLDDHLNKTKQADFSFSRWKEVSIKVNLIDWGRRWPKFVCPAVCACLESHSQKILSSL
jgi:hypothetical protein